MSHTERSRARDLSYSLAPTSAEDYFVFVAIDEEQCLFCLIGLRAILLSLESSLLEIRSLSYGHFLQKVMELWRLSEKEPTDEILWELGGKWERELIALRKTHKKRRPLYCS